MSSKSAFSGNRFSAIFTEDERELSSFDESSPMGMPGSSKKTTHPSTPVLTGSSLSKVDALLKFREAEKKRLAEEAEMRKKAAEEAARLAAEEEQRRKAEMLAKKAGNRARKNDSKIDDGFEIVKKDNRRKSHQQRRNKPQETNEFTERQIRRAHDREDRVGAKLSSKKGYTGHKESLDPIITEAIEEVAATPAAEPSVETETQASEASAPPATSPKNSVMTLEEYLSTKNTLVFDLPKRSANEGSGPHQFEKATPYMRMTESFLGFSIKDDVINNKSSPTSPTASHPAHGVSFVIDPRLQPTFSKPSPKGFKLKRNIGDKKAAKK